MTVEPTPTTPAVFLRAPEFGIYLFFLVRCDRVLLGQDSPRSSLVNTSDLST